MDWNYSKHIPGRRPDMTAVHVKKTAFLDRGLRFLVLVSHQMKRDLADLFPSYDMSKVRVIYPGVDTSKFSSRRRLEARARIARDHGVPTDKTWIVFAAGGDFEKRNTALLARALSRLRAREDWRFLFVGAEKGGVSWPVELDGRTHFLGRLGDISAVLPGCDVMAYPAWYDESPLVCLEAMASGLPIVISHKVGTSQVISDCNKEIATLRSLENEGELARIIEELLNDGDLRKKMGGENERVAQGFSWDMIYRQYRALYEESAAA